MDQIFQDTFSIIAELQTIASEKGSKTFKNAYVGSDGQTEFKNEYAATDTATERKIPIILSMGNLRMSARGSIENFNSPESLKIENEQTRLKKINPPEVLIRKLDSMIMDSPIKSAEDYNNDPKFEVIISENKDLQSGNLKKSKSSSLDELKKLSLRKIKGTFMSNVKSPLKAQVEQKSRNQKINRSDTLVIANPTLSNLSGNILLSRDPTHMNNINIDAERDKSFKVPETDTTVSSVDMQAHARKTELLSPSKTPKLTELMIQQFEDQKNLIHNRRMTDYKGPQYPWNNLFDLEPQHFIGDIDKYIKYITQYIASPQLTTKKSDIDVKKPYQGFWFLLNICKFPAEAFPIRLLTTKDINPEIKRHLLKDNAVYTSFNFLLTKIGPFLPNRETWTWICYAIPVQPSHGFDIDTILSDPLPFIVAAKEFNLPEMKDLYKLLDLNGSSFGLISYITLDISVFDIKHAYYPLVHDFIEANVYYWMNKVWLPILKLKHEKWLDGFCDEITKVAIPYIIHRFFRVINSRYGLLFLKNIIFNFCINPTYNTSKTAVPDMTEGNKKKLNSAIEKLLRSSMTSNYIPKLNDSSFTFKLASQEITDIVKNFNFIKYSRLVETSLVIETLALQHFYDQ
eukprot:NODE_89_length_21810_cov_0.170098.p2 type:complete len:628 gc:universal NODE_89_length_21810_cov_0.170098:12510-14393(+)